MANNCIDIGRGCLEFGRKCNLRDSAGSVALSHLCDLRIGESGKPVSLPIAGRVLAATLDVHVARILSMRAEEQMLWVDACPVIACMADADTARNLPEMDTVTHSVSQHDGSSIPGPAIVSTRRLTIPKPTRGVCSFVHMAPKSCDWVAACAYRAPSSQRPTFPTFAARQCH